MNGVGKRVQDIVVSATRDIESFPQRELPDSAFEQYAEALREPNNSYRDHATQTLPRDDELREGFQYEAAVLHVVSRALAFDIGLSNSAAIARLPVHQSDNLYSWYLLPDQLCNDIETIASDVMEINRHSSMIGKPEHLPRLRRRSNSGIHRTYNGYRSEIREDCRYRCVYCDLHERDVGGEREETTYSCFPA